ncbi:MAG: hypothetical protein LBJ25_07835 [Candidatus Margulisbacteria bacterium]|jgi:hypothetical protein|nr:hypothetical protein [Candidatus Margulisiibacteriota bacterium]
MADPIADNRLASRRLEWNARMNFHNALVYSWNIRYGEDLNITINNQTYRLLAEQYTHLLEHSLLTYTERPRDNPASQHTFWPEMGGLRNNPMGVMDPDKLQDLINNSKVEFNARDNLYSCEIKTEDSSLRKYNGMSFSVFLDNDNPSEIRSVFPTPRNHSEDYLRRAERDPSLRTYDARDIFEENGRTYPNRAANKTIAYQESIQQFNQAASRNGVTNPIQDAEGVAIYGGIIQPFDASYNDYYVSFPYMPYTNRELSQVIQELMIGIYLYDAEPWLSLEAQATNVLEVMIRPPYQDTLVAQTLVKLDYRMKGFLNGGYFPDSAVTLWPEAWRKAGSNHLAQQQVLQQYNYHDFHKYIRNYRSAWDYFSNIEPGPENKYTTSNIAQLGFQINGAISSVRSFKNLYFAGTFPVLANYTLFWTSAYAEAMNTRYKNNARYWREYEKVIAVMDSLRSDVNAYLQNDPETQQELRKLQVIIVLTSLLKTLKHNHLVPALNLNQREQKYVTPQTLPKLLSQRPFILNWQTIYMYSIEGGIGVTGDEPVENMFNAWPVGDFYNANLSEMNNVPINNARTFYLNPNSAMSILHIKAEEFYASTNTDYDWLLLYQD